MLHIFRKYRHKNNKNVTLIYEKTVKKGPLPVYLPTGCYVDKIFRVRFTYARYYFASVRTIWRVTLLANAGAQWVPPGRWPCMLGYVLGKLMMNGERRGRDIYLSRVFIMFNIWVNKSYWYFRGICSSVCNFVSLIHFRVLSVQDSVPDIIAFAVKSTFIDQTRKMTMKFSAYVLRQRVFTRYIHAALLIFCTLLKNVDQNDEILFYNSKLKWALYRGL